MNSLNDLIRRKVEWAFASNPNLLSSSRPKAFAVLFAKKLRHSQAILYSTSEQFIKTIAPSNAKFAKNPLRKSSIWKIIKVNILIAEIIRIFNANFA